MAEHERKPIQKNTRFNVFKRDGFCCQYCGSKPPTVVLEIDHVIPVSRGGGNHIDNLITACFDCNRGKSDSLLSAIPQSLEERQALIAEKLAQVKAYDRLLKTVRRKEDQSIDAIQDIFKSEFGGYVFTAKFRESVRLFLTKLPIDTVEKAMVLACNRIDSHDAAIKYFCGICWKTIKGDK